MNSLNPKYQLRDSKKKPILGISLASFNQSQNNIKAKMLERFEIVNPEIKSRDPEKIAHCYMTCDAIIAGTEPIDKLLLKSQTLKLILRAGVGNDNFSLDLATKKKIRVYNSVGPTIESVSSLIQASMMAISLGLLQNKLDSSSAWRTFFPLGIGNTKVSIIGFGRIGSRLLDKLILSGYKSFNIFDRVSFRDQLTKYSEAGIQISQENLSTCFSNGDIVSINLPLNEETKGLINFRLMQRMRADAWLVNFARGGVVNQNDLLAILEQEKIGGALLDVFDREPYFGPLRNNHRAFLTPHIGTYNLFTRDSMETELLEVAVDFFYGATRAKEE